MADFPSWQSYATFAFSVKRKERYFRAPEIEGFLRLVLETSGNRQKLISTGQIFWRAQLGHGSRIVVQDSQKFEDVAPHPQDRMKPLNHSATDGRVNPKGIPCLYLATDANTAMSEVRPWLGKYISLGQFKVMRDLRVIDCSVEHSEGYTFYFEEPSPIERERAVWREIDRSFSEPVNQDDATADYAPTQVLAEFFKRSGFDGIVYKSLLGGGFNVALFDLSAAEIINCSLHITRRVSFQFDETANPYFVKKHYPEPSPSVSQSR